MSILQLCFAGGACVCYLLLVRSYRWKRYNDIHRRYKRDGKLTPEDAQVIVHLSMTYDMPLLMGYSLEFALFKTFGIPSISQILVNTKQMSGLMATKRYMDTKILIATWMVCPLSGFSIFETAAHQAGSIDPRANVAIARTNFLHSQYPITNDDMLYTLSLFVTEPIRFAKEYGWRNLSGLECEAAYVYWREVGKRMKILDIPESLEKLVEWAEAYEETNMVPAESNELVATPNVEVLISVIPDILGLRNFARKVAVALIPERVRRAMRQPAQSRVIHAFLEMSIAVFAFTQRHLMLPRSKPYLFVERDLKCPVVHGEVEYPVRQHPIKTQGEPWYKAKPETTLEWIITRIEVAVGRYTEMPSGKLQCEGYVLETMGPERFINNGRKESAADAERLLGGPLPAAWTERLNNLQ